MLSNMLNYNELHTIVTKKEPAKVTIIPNPDGFGSQFQTIICAIIFSIRDKQQFIYTPLEQVEHNYNNDTSFIEKLEVLMNVRSHFTTMDKLDKETQKNVTILDKNIIKSKLDWNIQGFVTPDILNTLRNIFWSNKDRNHFKNNKKNVAIHIRRPNVIDETLLEEHQKLFSYYNRYNTDEYFLGVIQRIRDENPGADLLFHIYSQTNKRSNFDCYVSEDIQLHIDEDICSTFIGLAAADILVTSVSSFSYIAGFLNYGTVIYFPFWHKPLSHWLTYTDFNPNY
jgi:hypothetical protein